jgi:chromosome segregation ATPase
MSIKLLPKSELANLKAKEKTREIQEGVKLATRVDGLRELYAKTETDLEKYRTATLARINEEITALNGKKEELVGRMSQLQGKYDAMLPEIPMKRSELDKFEKSLRTWEKKLEKKEESAGLMEIDVKEALDSAEKSRIRAEDNERISRNLLVATNQKKQESETMLSTTRKIQEGVYKEKESIEQALELREISIKTKEQELSRKELSLMNFEKELNEEKVRVNDTRAMLERSIARLREGRHA